MLSKSIIEKMEESGNEERVNKQFNQEKIFTVPSGLEKVTETITINLHTDSKPSKEQIINQAFKFHSKGNIPEAAKYYQLFINQGFKDCNVFSNYGGILKDLGKLKEAELITRKAIELNPYFADAHANLGSILIDLDKLKEAESATRKAIELKPEFAMAYFNLGNILKDLDKLHEAEKTQRKVIELNPNFAMAYFSLGRILIDLDKLKEAELATRKAIELNPNFADAHANLGRILIDLDKLKEAELATRKAIELNPAFTIAHSNLGIILKDLKKFEEAELATRKAIELNPNLAMAHSNLGGILRDLGKLNEAEKCQQKAIALEPDYAEAYLNLGIILRDIGKLKEAETYQRKAVKLKPNFEIAHNILGNTLFDLGIFNEAEISQRKAIKLNPKCTEAHFSLGNILSNQDKYIEAKEAYQKCIEIDPKQSHIISNLILNLSRLFMWDEIEKYLPYINKIGIDGKAVDPLGLMYFEDSPLNHLKRATNYYQRNKRSGELKFNHQKNNKIRIGYFSSDFRNHSISHLITRTLELHDKDKFEIYAYSLISINDSYTKRIKEAVFKFKDLSSLGDIEIVRLAREDNLDIAIDLNGYTKHNRRSIFSYRVSPIQINYLGYPGSLGSDEFDYILADKILIPISNKKFYSEKVLYHPNSFIPHDDTKQISKKIFRKEELGLPSNGFVFVCFNSILKITRNEFKIWMRLLKKIEKSVLWIMKPNQTAIKNIFTELENNGLHKERVVFAKKMDLKEHLSRHSCGDLFLDTFNFNAGTTATDALWSGLPMITMIGQSFSARMAASILNACNLNELITHSESEYEALAYELATNENKLNKIRKKINNMKDCSLFDSSQFTRNLEEIYNNIYINHELNVH